MVYRFESTNEVLRLYLCCDARADNASSTSASFKTILERPTRFSSMMFLKLRVARCHFYIVFDPLIKVLLFIQADNTRIRSNSISRTFVVCRLSHRTVTNHMRCVHFSLCFYMRTAFWFASKETWLVNLKVEEHGTISAWNNGGTIGLLSMLRIVIAWVTIQNNDMYKYL